MEAPRGEVVHAGYLEVWPAERMALAHGRPINLTGREFQVLVALAHRMPRIVPREELYRTVWGHELRESDRSVDVYVSKLRGKLEREIPDWRFIHTHFGFGYRFSPEPSHTFHNAATDRQQALDHPAASLARISPPRRQGG